MLTKFIGTVHGHHSRWRGGDKAISEIHSVLYGCWSWGFDSLDRHIHFEFENIREIWTYPKVLVDASDYRACYFLSNVKDLGIVICISAKSILIENQPASVLSTHTIRKPLNPVNDDI